MYREREIDRERERMTQVIHVCQGGERRGPREGPRRLRRIQGLLFL